MGYAFRGYEMRSLRKEDLSLYYHLKHVGLFEFIETEILAPAQKLDTEEFCSTDFSVYTALVEWCENPEGFEPDPTERGRGWVYLDSGTVISGTDQCDPYVTVTGTDVMGTVLSPEAHPDDPSLWSGIPEQSDRIKVYTIPSNIDPYTLSASALKSYEISDQDYMLDYIDGRVITLPGVVPTHITYAWHYISLVDEWAAVEAANPPVVVIDMHGSDPVGYQLGGGKKMVRKVDLHIFATNPAERNDIVEELVDSLFNRTAPLYDFPLGTILEYDGTWYGRKDSMNKLTSLFNRQQASHIIGNMEFENVNSRHVSLPLVMTRDRNEVILSDLNAYRSKVSFDLVTYTKK